MRCNFVSRQDVKLQTGNLGVKEEFIKISQTVYRNARRGVWVNGAFSDGFSVQVGLH